MFRCMVLILGMGLCMSSGCGGTGDDYVEQVEAIPQIPQGRSSAGAAPFGGESKDGASAGRPAMPPG